MVHGAIPVVVIAFLRLVVQYTATRTFHDVTNNNESLVVLQCIGFVHVNLNLLQTGSTIDPLTTAR
jgi:hypothetical protein